MTTTDYNQQAEAFLERFGIKFRCTLSDSKTAPWQEKDPKLDRAWRHHYRVTLSRNDPAVRRESWKPLKRIVFDFFGSIADAEKLKKAATELQNMQLQMQNTEPHLRINLREELTEREKAVAECHPSAYDVLACISSDTYCAESFDDWCGEMGESTDSIRALQTYRRCAAFAKRLNQFFTTEEIEALREIQ